jgi:hypothetical protein
MPSTDVGTVTALTPGAPELSLRKACGQRFSDRLVATLNGT